MQVSTSGRAAAWGPSLTASQATHRSLQPAYGAALRAQAGEHGNKLPARSRFPTCTIYLHLVSVWQCPADRPTKTEYVAASAGVQQRGMFIQTQPTPNPSSLMFLPGQAVSEVRPQGLSGFCRPDALEQLGVLTH